MTPDMTRKQRQKLTQKERDAVNEKRRDRYAKRRQEASEKLDRGNEKKLLIGYPLGPMTDQDGPEAIAARGELADIKDDNWRDIKDDVGKLVTSFDIRTTLSVRACLVVAAVVSVLIGLLTLVVVLLCEQNELLNEISAKQSIILSSQLVPGSWADSSYHGIEAQNHGGFQRT